jgi:hypothetical protein
VEIIEVKNRLELYSFFPKNGVGAELGTCRGDNGVRLFNATSPSQLYLVDIWERDDLTYKHHTPELYYDDWQDSVREKLPNPNVHLVKQDTVQWLESIPNDFLDWIYIDSDHNYSHVNKEYSLAVQKVKRGGVISGHDFYVHETAWKTGVIRAVFNQINNHNMILTHITNQEFSSILCRNTKP